MGFFFLIGTHFFSWGSGQSDQPMKCGRCGTFTYFTTKKGMNFITLFFIIPVVPISGVSHLLVCPQCKAKYRAS
jgi:hypothetical protein